MRKVDYAGRKFNNIEVIKEIGQIYQGNRKRGLWLCKCSCGNFIKMSSNEIARGERKSCGCIRNERKRKVCRYDFCGGYIRGYDEKNSEFLFDVEDFEKIKDYCWYVSQNGAVQTSIDKKTVTMHRFIFENNAKGKVIDHINHNRADNRRTNLRVVSQKDNMKNQKTPKNSTSGRVGVTYNKQNKKYRASIKINGKYIFGGYFNSFNEAVKKREELEKQYFGEYRNKYL